MARTRPSKTQPRSLSAPGPLPIPVELITAGIPLDADLELDRQRRLEALKAQLTRMFAKGRGAEAIDQVMLAMADLERANERLAWRVLRANRYRFGRSTQKLSTDELRQLFLGFDGDESVDPPGAEPDVPAPLEPEQIDDRSAEEAARPGETKRKTRKRVRSMRVAPSVERNVTVVPADRLRAFLFEHVGPEMEEDMSAVEMMLEANRHRKGSPNSVASNRA